MLKKLSEPKLSHLDVLGILFMVTAGREILHGNIVKGFVAAGISILCVVLLMVADNLKEK